MSDDKTGAKTGGCLCGKVRYEAAGDPLFAGLCQCDHCQRQSGSAFLGLVAFPKGAVTITQGKLATYTATSDRERNVYREFCKSCGSPVRITLDLYPDICAMTSGCLDDRSIATPSFSFWCDRQPNWLALPAELTRYPGYPEQL